MCVYIYIYIDIHICLYIYILFLAKGKAKAKTRMYECICGCTYVCMCVYVSVHICVYVCMCVCMYVCTYESKPNGAGNAQPCSNAPDGYAPAHGRPHNGSPPETKAGKASRSYCNRPNTPPSSRRRARSSMEPA